MFRRALLVWLVLTFVPAVAFSQNPGIKQGDPAFFFGFPGGTLTVIRGEAWCDQLYATNFYWSSTLCAEGLIDTFAVVTSDIQGWPITNTFIDDSDAEGTCIILDDDVALEWYFVVNICIAVPCEAVPGELNTLTVQMAYCDGSMTAQPDSGDCEDPNWRSGDPYVPCFSTLTQDFEVVASPPSLYILQDTLYYVEQGQSAAYIPFELCNGDPCAPPTDYVYIITNSDPLDPIEQADTTYGLSGGECVDVYAVVDASMKPVCHYDTLTIIAWEMESGAAYDTCVQAWHVIEGLCCVPVMSRTAAGLLIVLLIAVSAVALKRRMV